MGCAGSSPLPAGDTMVANGRAAVDNSPLDAHTADPKDKACSIVQKVVNIDEVVKKIQGIPDLSTAIPDLTTVGRDKYNGEFATIGAFFFFIRARSFSRYFPNALLLPLFRGRQKPRLCARSLSRPAMNPRKESSSRGFSPF